MIGIRHGTRRSFRVVKRIAHAARFVEHFQRFNLRALRLHQNDAAIVLQIKRNRLAAVSDIRPAAFVARHEAGVAFAVSFSRDDGARPMFIHRPLVVHTRRFREIASERRSGFRAAL